MGRYLATSVAFRLLFIVFAFCLSDSGLAGGCVGCGQRGRVIKQAPVFRNQGPVFMSNPSPCGGRPCGGGGFSSMPSPCGGRPCGQSFSVGQPSNCGGLGNCGARTNVASSCGGNRSCGGNPNSGGGGACHYGENQNVLICSDGILDRGADNIFRMRKGGAAPATQAAPGNFGGVQQAPALGLNGSIQGGSHTDSGNTGAPLASQGSTSQPQGEGQFFVRRAEKRECGGYCSPAYGFGKHAFFSLRA